MKGWDEVVGQGAIGVHYTAGIMMVSVALWLCEDVHFDRLLAAVELRHCAAMWM
jgi:hypothetical protein